MKNKECKWFPVCPMNYFFSQGKISEHWINDYCHGNWNQCERYKKEESGIYHPDNMMPDGSINRGL
jgi:hypothetical protein